MTFDFSDRDRKSIAASNGLVAKNRKLPQQDGGYDSE